MTDPTPPGGYEPPSPPPPGYGQAPAYGEPSGYGAGGYGQPAFGGYKGAQLGLPQTGPNSLASQWARLGARVLDGLILFVPMLAIYFALAGDALSEIEAGDQVEFLSGDFFLATLVFLALTAAYEIYFLSRSGATPGKKALGIRVANIADGGNPSTANAAARWAIANVPGYVTIASLFTLVNTAWCLWDDNRQCLHDKAVKTVVVNN